MSTLHRCGLTLLASVLCLVVVPATASADVLELKDGRLVEGIVLKDGAKYLVTDRFGAAEIPVADVAKVHPGKSVDALVREHVAKLTEDDTEGRVTLAAWLKKIGRGEEAREQARAVLDLDPEHAAAHAFLGHIRHRGQWVTPDDAKRAEGYIKKGEKWYTPAEWRNLSEADRDDAAAAAELAKQAAFRADVNRAVRLMMSPDPKVRERGRTLLLGLARETGEDSLIDLAKQVDAHVAKVEALRERAAKAAALAPGARGTVMGEIRATMSKLKRPIEVFETPLASSAAGGSVRIQLPEVEVVNVRTTGIIPAVVR